MIQAARALAEDLLSARPGAVNGPPRDGVSPSSLRVDTSFLTLFLFVLSAIPAAAQSPGWSLDPAAFPRQMVVTGQLRIGGNTSTSTLDSVAAFVGPELRGVTGVTSSGFVFLTIYGDTPGESIRFQAFDADADPDGEVIDLFGSLLFVPDCRQSSPSMPYLLADLVPDGSTWAAPDETIFGERMSLTAITENGSAYEALGAFIGAELRGLVEDPAGLGGIVYLDIFDLALAGDCSLVHFYAYDADTGMETPLAQHLYFGAGSMGTPSDPIVLSQSGSIAGTKFNDLDVDGTWDPDEPALAAWTIELLDENMQLVATALTGTDGGYLFAGLAAGAYFVREVAKDGWARTVPIEEAHQVEVAPAQAVTGVDFGNTQSPATVSGVSFEDIDGNRGRDGGEPGLEGWTITATNDQGQLVSTAVSGADGGYILTLAPGTYTVAETPQGGWVQTSPVGNVYAVSLQANDVGAGLDFGNSRTIGRLSGVTFNDRNADGVQDGNEAGLAGWTIEVVDGADQLVASAQSLDGGGYEVFLAPGAYTVRVADSTGWVQTFPTEGAHTVSIRAGMSIEGIDFGITRDFGRITGAKFNDLDGDGRRGSGEPGLSGWTIEGFGADGVRVGVAVTGSDGVYALLLPGGRYAVREVQQRGWAATFPRVGAHTIELTNGETVVGVDFGNTMAVGTIEGIKFADTNANGQHDGGEPALPGWEITVSDGGDIVARDTTDQAGAFGFTLPAGTYLISETLQAGWQQTFPPAPGTHAVELSTNEALTGLDFGNVRTGSISGTKWDDRNGDGVQNNNDKGLAGWVIELLVGAAVVMRDTTDAAGMYAFSALLPGAYTVREKQQTGWTQTFPAGPGTHVVTLAAGQNVTAVNFGNARSTTGGGGTGTIEGLKFEDVNGNGVQDRREKGLKGWLIEALDANAAVAGTATTNVQGKYAVTGLAAGTYTVREVQQVGWRQTFPSGSGTHVVVLGAGATVSSIDFGNQLTGGAAQKSVATALEGEEVPEVFALAQNYPNPFNPSTTSGGTTGTQIRFALPEAATVTLRIYNMMGREVARLAEGSFAPGVYVALWDGRNRSGSPVPSGVYLYRMTAGAHAAVRQMILLK